MIQKLYLKAIIIIFSLLLTSCEDLFEFSPYETRIDESLENYNSKNIDLIIKNSNNENKKLTIALIADSHADFDKLNKSINNINHKGNIDFTVFMGDQADHGLLHEYKSARKQFEKLNNPYLCILGNHDCLSNGKSIYNKMYGKDNFTLTIGNCIFIFFNDVVWENNNTNPDFQWLENTLNKHNFCENKIVFAHIPHTTDQFTQQNKDIYYNIMQKYDVDFSIHGHNHGYGFDKNESDSTVYLTVGSTMSNNICYLHILNNQVWFEHETF